MSENHRILQQFIGLAHRTDARFRNSKVFGTVDALLRSQCRNLRASETPTVNSSRKQEAMSGLKILVCTLLFAATSWTTSTAVADHGWPSNQNPSCGRSGGSLNSSNLAYRPLGASNGYSNNYGYGVRSTPQNYGYNSHGVRGLVYDSAHNDYHVVPGRTPQQYPGNFSGRARNPHQNNSVWLHGNSGW